EAMRDVARAEDVVARARLDGLVADLEGEIALEDPEPLIVPVMDVKRCLGAGVLGSLADRHLAAGVGGCGLDFGQRAEPPACLAFVRADRHWLQRLDL